MLNNCLAQVCQAFEEEQDLEKKMTLCQEITHFLLSTPQVFEDELKPLSPGTQWINHVKQSIKHLIQNKIPQDKRVNLFRLISALTHGFNRVDWLFSSDWTDEDTKLFGLLTRLTCIELVMLLDKMSPLQEKETDLLGCLLILVEKEMTCLLEVDKATQRMTPQEIGSLISSFRGVASNMITFLSQSVNANPVENQSQEERDTSTFNCSLQELSMVRFLCQWILEDSDISEDQTEQLTPLLLQTFTTISDDNEGSSLRHGILSALLILHDIKPIFLDGQLNIFDNFTSECHACREGELSICQEFRVKILFPK